MIRNVGTFGADANGEVTSGMNHKRESRERSALLLFARAGDRVALLRSVGEWVIITNALRRRQVNRPG